VFSAQQRTIHQPTVSVYTVTIAATEPHCLWKGRQGTSGIRVQGPTEIMGSFIEPTTRHIGPIRDTNPTSDPFHSLLHFLVESKEMANRPGVARKVLDTD